MSFGSSDELIRTLFLCPACQKFVENEDGLNFES